MATIDKAIFKICERKSKKTVGLISFFATKMLEKNSLKDSEITNKHEIIRG